MPIIVERGKQIPWNNDLNSFSGNLVLEEDIDTDADTTIGTNNNNNDLLTTFLHSSSTFIKLSNK
jgi:hypothetical protein